MITEKIVETLKSLYPDIPVYVEAAEVESNKKCFYIRLANQKCIKGLNGRSNRMASYDICYYGQTSKNCEMKANQLYEDLEYLQNNFARGTNMNHKVKDKELHFFVDYNIRLLKEKNADPKISKMEVNSSGN